MRKLTHLQQRFVEEYLVDLNATKACERAGYKGKSRHSFECQGTSLLRNLEVSRAIQEAVEARKKRVEITQDDVLRDLIAVKERCMQATPVVNMKGNQVKDQDGNDLWTFDAKGANRALELIGKHLGMFVERRELSGPGGRDLIGDASKTITVGALIVPDVQDPKTWQESARKLLEQQEELRKKYAQS